MALADGCWTLEAPRHDSDVWCAVLDMPEPCCFSTALIPTDVMLISAKSGGGDVRLFDDQTGCLGDDRAGPCAIL